METRETKIIEVRVFVLVLNTFGSAEEGRIVAFSTDYNRLVEAYNRDLLPYDKGFRDEVGFYHSFRESSPFYNYNPCYTTDLNMLSPFGHGIHDEWIEIDQFERLKRSFLFIN